MFEEEISPEELFRQFFGGGMGGPGGGLFGGPFGKANCPPVSSDTVRYQAYWTYRSGLWFARVRVQSWRLRRARRPRSSVRWTNTKTKTSHAWPTERNIPLLLLTPSTHPLRSPAPLISLWLRLVLVIVLQHLRKLRPRSSLHPASHLYPLRCPVFCRPRHSTRIQLPPVEGSRQVGRVTLRAEAGPKMRGPKTTPGELVSGGAGLVFGWWGEGEAGEGSGYVQLQEAERAWHFLLMYSACFPRNFAACRVSMILCGFRSHWKWFLTTLSRSKYLCVETILICLLLVHILVEANASSFSFSVKNSDVF